MIIKKIISGMIIASVVLAAQGLLANNPFALNVLYSSVGSDLFIQYSNDGDDDDGGSQICPKGMDHDDDDGDGYGDDDDNDDSCKPKVCPAGTSYDNDDGDDDDGWDDDDDGYGDDDDGDGANDCVPSNLPPVAQDDEGGVFLVGVVGRINPFDDNGNGVDLDPDGTLDFSSFSFVDSGSGRLSISGEGVWEFNSILNQVVFTPVASFLNSPTPVSYVVSDNEGLSSNEAEITFIYQDL